jgi:hypothetical protein
MSTLLIDGVRRRPGMYIGSPNAFGFRELINQLVTEHLDASDAHFDEVSILTRSDQSVRLEFRGNFPHAKPVDVLNQWATRSNHFNRYHMIGVAAGLSEFLQVEFVHPDGLLETVVR